MSQTPLGRWIRGYTGAVAVASERANRGLELLRDLAGSTFLANSAVHFAIVLAPTRFAEP
jgi:hypothetical protein